MKRLLLFVLLAASAGMLLIFVVKGAQGHFGPNSRLVTGFLLLLIIACTISLRLLGTRWREAVTNSWLVVISSFSTYVVCDLVLGSLFLPNIQSAGIPDVVVHHRYAPKVTSMMVKPEFDIQFTTNNLGLRGRDVEPQKPPGVCRILTIGDSFTFGYGVEDNQTFSALLERSLRKDGALNVQVLNAGVASYSPILEYLFLKTYGVRWQPDFVVFAFDMGDLLQEQYYRSLARFDKSGVPLSVDGTADYRGQRPDLRILQWVGSHMLIGSWVVRGAFRRGGQSQTLQGIVEQANHDLLQHTLKGYAENYNKEWRGVYESIRLAFRLARENGSGFVLVAYPWGHQVSASEWSVGRKDFLAKGEWKVSDRSLDELRRFAAREGIPFLDLFPAFRGYAGGEKLYHDIDMHWTPAGHKLAAEQLTKFFMEQRLQAWCHQN